MQTVYVREPDSEKVIRPSTRCAPRDRFPVASASRFWCPAAWTYWPNELKHNKTQALDRAALFAASKQ